MCNHRITYNNFKKTSLRFGYKKKKRGDKTHLQLGILVGAVKKRITCDIFHRIWAAGKLTLQTTTCTPILSTVFLRFSSFIAVLFYPWRFSWPSPSGPLLKAQLSPWWVIFSGAPPPSPSPNILIQGGGRPRKGHLKQGHQVHRTIGNFENKQSEGRSPDWNQAQTTLEGTPIGGVQDAAYNPNGLLCHWAILSLMFNRITPHGSQMSALVILYTTRWVSHESFMERENQHCTL